MRGCLGHASIMYTQSGNRVLTSVGLYFCHRHSLERILNHRGTLQVLQLVAEVRRSNSARSSQLRRCPENEMVSNPLETPFGIASGGSSEKRADDLTVPASVRQRNRLRQLPSPR